MARPKKTSSEPEARLRIRSAFWEELEGCSLRDVTVGALCSRAHCNRGTFYYHFRDIDELIDWVIEDELCSGKTIAENIFRMGTGEGACELFDLNAETIYRMKLIVSRGGLDVMLPKVRAVVLGMWESVLCVSGERLTDEAKLIIGYCVGGLMTQLLANDNDEIARILRTPTADEFLRCNARFLVQQVARAQGKDFAEAMSSLSAVTQYMGAMRAQGAGDSPRGA